MATSSIVSGLLWQLFIGPVPLMKDAHQHRDVKDTDCPTTEESRLSLFTSVLCPLQLPRSQYGFLSYLNPKPPLSFPFVCFSLDDLHWRRCKISKFGWWQRGEEAIMGWCWSSLGGKTQTPHTVRYCKGRMRPSFFILREGEVGAGPLVRGPQGSPMHYGFSQSLCLHQWCEVVWKQLWVTQYKSLEKTKSQEAKQESLWPLKREFIFQHTFPFFHDSRLWHLSQHSW